MRRRRALGRSDARPGFVLSFQGAEIGVVERVETSALDGTPTLRVRGGVSGCLEYVIPSHAVASVDSKERRAGIHDGVVFEAEQIGDDGRVILVARIDAPAVDGPDRT